MDRVIYSPPFKATQTASGWWTVIDSDGLQIDDSGDGGFFAPHAILIANALNTLDPADFGEQELPPQPIYLLHIHLEEREVFNTLAEVTRCLIDKQPMIYRLEIVENDLIRTLITAEETKRLALPERFYSDRSDIPFGDATCKLPGDSVVHADFGKKDR